MSQTLVSEYKLKLPDRKLLKNKLKQVKELLENEKKIKIDCVSADT